MSRAFVGKVLIAVVLVSGASRTAEAEEATPAASLRPTLGVFWSANATKFAHEPGTPLGGWRQWAGAGGSIDVPLARNVSIDTRLMWARRGATLSNPSTPAYGNVRINYLSVPALFKVGGTGPVHGYALAGPELAVRLSSSVSSENGARIDGAKMIERTDFMVDAGGGLERNMGSSRLFVEGVYSHGLKNVLGAGTVGNSARTRTLTLMAGLRF